MFFDLPGFNFGINFSKFLSIISSEVSLYDLIYIFL